MIAKNEEYFIKDSLDSVKDLVDEIIVFVDSNSKDKTEEIAKKYTDKVYKFQWENNFSKARNLSLEKATKDWILILDADETISKKDHQKIKELINLKEHAAYALTQLNYTNNKSLFGFTQLKKSSEDSRGYQGYISANIIRLFRNHKGIVFEGPVHETVRKKTEEVGKIKLAEVPIHHYQFSKGEDFHKKKQINYMHIYEDNLKLHPNKAKVYSDIAIIASEFKKDYSKAEEYFNKSLDLDKHNIKTYRGLAQVQLKKNNLQKALKTTEEGLIRFPKNPFLLNLRNSLLKAISDQKV